MKHGPSRGFELEIQSSDDSACISFTPVALAISNPSMLSLQASSSANESWYSPRKMFGPIDDKEEKMAVLTD